MKIEELKAKTQAMCTVFANNIKTYAKKVVRVLITFNGESFATADHSLIQIGLMPHETEWEWDNILKVLRFKKDHELQHILSTDSEEFSAAIRDISDQFTSAGLNKALSLKYGKFLVNGLEDGRIENIMVTERKGSKPLRDWYRLMEYEVYTCSENTHPLLTAITQLHSVACRGFFEKGFTTVCEVGDETREIVESCVSLVSQAVSATTTRGCGDACREIAKKLLPLLKLDSSNDGNTDDELDKELAEKLANMSNNNISNLDKGENWREQIQTGSKIIGILTDESEESDSDGNSIVPDEIIDLRTKNSESKDDSEENSPKEKKPSKGESNTQEGDISEESDDASGNTGEELDDSTKENAGKAGDDSKSVEDVIKDRIKDLEEDIERTLRKQEELVERQQNLKLQKITQAEPTSERDKNSKPLDKDVTTDIAQRHHYNPNNMPQEIPYNKENWQKQDCPFDIESRANRIREDIKKVLAKDVEDNYREELYEGDFDVDGITKLCLGDFSIYKEKADEPDTVWHDILFLKDNSGSMGGYKNLKCCEAMAMIEEIVKGINGISLKIADYSDKKHGIIKNWSDNDMSFNYAWSYCYNERTDCGQIDDYSIDYYSTELAQRPAATSKLMLLLTDGEPCVPRDDVLEMVNRARQNGITFLIFFIGYNKERILSEPSRYEDIYGKGCCYAIDKELSNLEEEFLNLLKANVKY